MRIHFCIAVVFSSVYALGQTDLSRCSVNHTNLVGSVSNTKSYPRESIEIPVVFHIVHRTTQENLTEELIFSQLEVLNEDYNAQNDDLSIVPDEFEDDIGNAQISFCLANIDPSGNPSTGIVRVRTPEQGIANQDFIVNGTRAIKSSEAGGSDPWDTKKYLNIWIGSRTDGNLGDATFPNSEEPDKIDGIVVDYKAIGRYESEDFPFHLGRTLTHEIAHYLNVYHLFGSETGCFSEGDFVDDTPTQFGRYFGPCEGPVFSCDSRDMDMNFLNFRDDDCLVFFTKGQVQRMREVLFTDRFELITSDICSKNRPIPDDPLKIARVFQQRGEVVVELSTLFNREYTIELYDISGRIIGVRNSNPAHTYRFNHDYFPTGIYVLRLRLDDRNWVKKLFIL